MNLENLQLLQKRINDIYNNPAIINFQKNMDILVNSDLYQRQIKLANYYSNIYKYLNKTRVARSNVNHIFGYDNNSIKLTNEVLTQNTITTQNKGFIKPSMEEIELISQKNKPYDEKIKSFIADENIEFDKSININTINPNDIYLEVKFVQDKYVIINNYVSGASNIIGKPNFDSTQYHVINYLMNNPNIKIRKSELEEYLNEQMNIVNKNITTGLSKVVERLGFKNLYRSFFINVSENSIKLIPTISYENYYLLNETKNILS